MLWKKLTFTEEEDVGIVLDSSSTRAAKEVGKCCVVMKILTQRCISLDALRKNLRMLWKPNKGVQISEIDEELFLVEFGDGKDKKRVIEMCPWNYEKQLILIQDFEGELTPKEIDIKWAPFWIQIYNLPLKCRTKETGWAIGSSLGTVLDVDVPESSVQWGKCLRVRVRIDTTKRVLRGKKVTIEGGESRWVSFKFERLPNFCYRCGLLDHTLKDCSEEVDTTIGAETNTLQYGSWLRGDPLRRSGYESFKMGSRTEGGSGSGKTEGSKGRSSTVTQEPSNDPVSGGNHGSELTALKASNSMQDSNPRSDGDGSVPYTPLSEDLRENGNLTEREGKLGGSETSMGCQKDVQTSVQVSLLAEMQWETAHSWVLEESHVGALVPTKILDESVMGQIPVGQDLGLSTNSHTVGQNGIVETPSPPKKKGIRPARDAKSKSSNNGKCPLEVKKEGPTPLQVVDTNIQVPYDSSNLALVPENKNGTVQAKWKRIPRMETGTPSFCVGLAGSKRPTDMVSDLNELPSKKILVSHSKKENHLVMAKAGSQPRQVQ